MQKSDIQLPPSYFDTYINKVPDLPLLQALSKYGLPLIEQHRDQWTSMGDFVYAEDKWNINQIIQHIIDTERIFAYRALRMARKDATPLPGFDQDPYNDNVDSSSREISDLIKELITVRQSSLWLYESLSEEALLFKGTASGLSMNALALGYMITGHFIHHVNILEERYYPLLKAQ